METLLNSPRKGSLAKQGKFAGGALSQSLRAAGERKKQLHASLRNSALSTNQPGKAKEHRLVELFNSAQYSTLDKELRELIVQVPGYGFAWKLLGASQQLQRHHALDALQTAVRLLPQDAQAHCNLGVALKQAGQPDAAIASYQQALQINPRYADALCYLANAQRELGHLEDALASCHQALELAPEFCEAHTVMGSTLKECGRFDMALQSLRTSLSLLFKKYRNLAHVPPPDAVDRYRCTPPINVAAAHATIDALKARLDAASLPWCLFAGSLLGVVRNGDLLPHDKDLDIAMPAAVDRQQLLQLLTNDGAFQLVARINRGVQETHVYDLCLVHRHYGVSVDVFFLHPDGPAHFLVGPDHPGQPILCRIPRFELGQCAWRGGMWPIPVQYEIYLSSIYGNGWHEADPFFDTVISNPSRVAQAIPVVLCYGYAKLISHLQNRHWPAVQAYCNQLQRRVQDPLLEELLHWVVQLPVTAQKPC